MNPEDYGPPYSLDIKNEETEETDGPRKVIGAVSEMHTTDTDEIELVFKLKIDGKTHAVSILVPPEDKYNFSYAEAEYRVRLDGASVTQVQRFYSANSKVWYDVLSK